MKELDQEDVQIKTIHSAHPSQRLPEATIDFHGVEGGGGSQHLTSQNHPASNGR